MFVIGNGFTLSFLHRRPSLLQTWHSSRPLAFDVPTPGSAIPLLDNLPFFKTAVQAHRQTTPNVDDFMVMRSVLDHTQDFMTRRRVARTPEEEIQAKTAFRIDTEARHFFSLAYSHLQLRMESEFHGPWEWPEWFARFFLPRDLIFVISFNYDLLIETLLHKLSFRMHQQCGGGDPGVVVFKPHGSINYEIRGIGGARSYPLSIYAGWNNGEIEVIPHSDLLHGRIQPVALLPTERTIYMRARFNQQGYLEACAAARDVNRLVIIGFSYSHADRHEFDFILGHLAPSAAIYLVDPCPPKALIQTIQDRGFRLNISNVPPDLRLTP